MAKALYGFITYPESIDTEFMKQWLSDTLNVEWACCLHDKDVYKDGKPKKPHVHWLIGFEKSKKSIKELLKIFASRWYYVPLESVLVNREDVEKFVNFLTVEGVETPPVPDSPAVELGNVAKPLVTRFLQMYSAQGAEDYLEHKNQPEKAQYVGLSEHSEFWDVNNYLTYSEKRNAKKEESAGEIIQLLQYIRKNQIIDYVSLLDSLAENAPGLLSLAFQKSYSIDKYLMNWKMVDRYKQMIHENGDMKAKINWLERTVENQAVKLAEAGIIYQEYTGENPDVD